MSDVSEVEAGEVTTPVVPATAGALLRAAREVQGLHIAALAVALKVPVKKIEALEADRLQDLPDTVFVRSMAMSICRVLKTPPEPVLALLPDVSGNKLQPMDGGLNTRFRDVSLASQSTWRNQLLSPMGLGVVALLVAILGVLAWRVPEDEAVVESSPANLPLSAAAVAAPVAAPVAAMPVQSASTVQPASTVMATGTLSMTEDIRVPDADSGPATLAEKPAAAVPLEIKAKGVSWVEVTDADGTARVHRLTVAGESFQVTGKLPLSVVLGRADQMEVLVRGRPLNLKDTVRDNVARFEVK